MTKGIYKRPLGYIPKSAFKKGHKTWNKGLRIQTNTGKTHFKKGSHLSEATKNKMSISRKGLHKGSKHPNFKGKTKTTKGYVLIYMPEHPFAFHGKRYIQEHRFIVEKIIGHYLKPSNRIHHINGIKDDNRPENLIAFKNESAHQKFERNCKIKSTDIIFDGRQIAPSV